ncbi:molybdopterin-containing oxidoreductase family protein [Tepidibacillus fermentans]|uniref:Anaerobic selenocysteine-containing dehydrogenase n=1 Tax=Tepidibacillus fermentans TaxID=1281767 RepID=A0A4V2USC0_9BACI|nr:molybdopterin-dependent oxidoreductase [Tepidibacillus fermentans]TCS80802.1 anaerobic selenocysteine-containing dehydrogenase [Tepidibacillus fermentans]
MGKTWKTACPLNCFDVCGFLVTTENGKVVSIKGDPEHPITRGKICGRGKMLKDRMYHDDRLHYPLKKVNGQFVRISWDQALDEISLKMKEIKMTYGPTAILHSYDYASGGLLKELDQRFFNFFGGMTKVIGSLCWGAGIQAQIYDMGNSFGHGVEDIKNTQTIVIWGRNITTTNMHLYPFIMEAKQQGAKLVVINPMKNGIAKEADLHLPITPGMDGNLALAMSKVIIENGWHDQEFIDLYTVGFEEFKKELEKLKLENISKEINIDVKNIVQLAKWYAQNRPVMTFLGLGMQRYTNGGNTIRAIDALAALTGNIGVAGGGVNYAHRAVGQSFGWDELLREDLRQEYRTFSRPSQAEEIIEAKEPPIKMMFISRTNLLTQLPNISRTLKAFEQVETKIVLDMFLTDTAKIADYVLPVVSVFEEEDIYYGSMFHSVVRYGPKLVDPPGEAWSDLKIWAELAKRLGLQGFERSREEYFEIALQPLNRFGIDLSVLKEKHEIELPLPKVAWADKKFDTPSGKFEFYSYQAEKDGYSPIAKIMYPKERLSFHDLMEPYPYQLLSIHPNKSLHSQHHWLNKEKEMKPLVSIPKEIAEKQGIKEKDLVMVSNQRGNLIGRAKIEEGSHPRTIIIEEGYGIDTRGNVNWLTANGLSDMGNGSIFYECKISIKKIDEE